jgi:hypothetical protein
MGAGRLDLTHAADPGVILNPPSLSFGASPTGTVKTLTFQVTSVADNVETYALETLYTGDGFTQTTDLPGFIVTPASLTLAPGGTATVQVTLNPAQSAGFGDNQGFLVLDGATYDAHLPVWARVSHAAPLADVLIIDNDFSDLRQEYDYRWYYTSTLDELGYSYAVWNTDDFAGSPTTIPDATTLAAYRAVLLFTGDNFEPDGTFTVPTGLTQLDQDRLVEYLNGGGTLLAMGQDLSSVLNAAVEDAPVGNRNFLYVYRLGANWIQDSVSNGSTPNGMITPLSTAPALFQDVIVDLTQPRKFIAAGELSGDEETPPVVTDTTGEFFLQYDVDQNELTYEITVVPTDTTPITVTLAHIHDGDAGASGPPIRDLLEISGVTPPIFVTDTFELSGVVTPSLTGPEIERLFANGLYVNVHTSVNPGGEVRGQIEPEALANQPYVDEIDNVFHDGSQDPTGDGTTSESNLGSTLLFRYNGPFNQYHGAVAAAHRDQPSLERPGTDYSGRSVYTSFGLEGMSNDFSPTLEMTPTTRSELLDRMLNWGWSEPPQVVISATTEANGGHVTFFTVTISETTTVAQAPAPTAVSFRWDFGDGAGFVPTTTPQASRQYTVCGNYTVQVEVTDSYGNVSIGTQQIRVTENCSEWQMRLPIIQGQ